MNTTEVQPSPDSTNGAHGDPAAMTGARSTVVIKPSHGFSLGLKEMWASKSLLYYIAWRDVKIRYKQTVFGAAWAVIQPLMLMVVFTVVLGHALSVPSDGIPYPVFSFAALVPWTLFAKSLEASASSIVMNTNLIDKIYFPRLILPIAACGSYLMDFVIGFAVLVLLMVVYGVHTTPMVILLPFFTLLALTTALAVGLWLSALYVRFRDVRHAVPFLIQLWLFATPVAYPITSLPDTLQKVFALNPMTGVVEGFRWALLGTDTAPGFSIAVSIVITLVTLATGLVYFQRTATTFADVI